MPFLPTTVTVVDADGNAVAVSTQATLAALLTELQAKTEPADQQHVIVDSAPASASAADVLTANADAGYVDGATGEPLTQTPDGRLRVLTAAIVGDSPLSGLIVGSNVAMSMTSDGRLRVSSEPGRTYLEMFRGGEPFFDLPDLTSTANIWDIGEGSPRGGLRAAGERA